MAERFENMILTRAQIDNGVAGFVVEEPNGERWTYRERTGIAKMQHEADMAYEIACPVCIGGVYSWIQDGEARYCLVCSGTGRVTLGGIVAADRARKVVPP